MVKFNLPQSSKIEVGKFYKDKTNSKNLKKVNKKLIKGEYMLKWDKNSRK